MYSDLDLKLNKKSNGDIPLLKDNEAIKVSIMNLLSFNLHDIFLNDYFGGFLKKTLFESDSQIHVGVIKTRIEWILKTYEPRISVVDVLVSNDNATRLKIDINYMILADDSYDNVTYIRDL